MPAPNSQKCRIPGCGQDALKANVAELLCLDHFLEHTFSRATQVLEQCQKSAPIDAANVEWLMADARVVTQLLIGGPSGSTAAQREKLLELLLCLANLQEHIRHHSVASPQHR